MIPSNWRDLTATLVFKDNWPQRNAMFCDGLTGPKYLVSQSHSCALFLGYGISFFDGFVNSAKPLLGNSHTKFALTDECRHRHRGFAYAVERTSPRLDRSSPLRCEPSVRA